MDRIVFAGGIPYSGKSTFCSELSKRDPRYSHLDLDLFASHLYDQDKKILSIMKTYDPKSYSEAKTLAKSAKVKKRNCLSHYKKWLCTKGRADEFKNNLHAYSALYAVESMKGFELDIIPVVDGLLHNEVSRDACYRLILYAFMGTQDIAKVPKFLIYFDLGLEQSLERHHSGVWAGRRNFITRECDIRESFEGQQLPDEKEMPNLNVTVISSESEIDSTLELLVDSF